MLFMDAVVPLLGVVGCCWMCSAVLSETARCCWILLDVVGCCMPLLDVVGCC